MATLSRAERLVAVLGKDSLPPKLPTSDTVSYDVANQQTETKEATASTQPAEDLNEGHDWWNTAPQIPQSHFTANLTTALAVPAISNAGDTTYPFDPDYGKPAPLGVSFSPFLAVTKFPYKFVKKELLQPIASAFFDEGKIWNREWDM